VIGLTPRRVCIEVDGRRTFALEENLQPRDGRHCGECLMNAVAIVELDVHGKCPRCGAEYGVRVAR